MATVKENVALILREKRGEFVSGEEIAKSLGVSRASVWKSISSLKNEGFRVESVTNKGYRFEGTEDAITSEGIKAFLGDELKSKFNIIVKSTISSTNTVLKQMAQAGEKEGTVILSGEQTSGRGRMGRSFFSPGDTGVYLSLLLRPDILPQDAVLITTAAAVSVCEALEQLGAQGPKIKWVNDIFINSKKVCGILTEAGFNMEGGTLDYAVLGVGVNMYEPKNGFPKELKDIAGSVFPKKSEDLRNKFVALFLTSFENYYKNLPLKKHSSEYEKRCFVVGKKIGVIRGDRVREATALAIDENCGLRVKYDDGKIETLNSGEISVRVI